MKKYDCYIASGWFSPNQANDLENIKKVLNELNVKFFSPKDEIICPPMADQETRKQIFNGNLEAIKNSDFIIVNTREKDLGTIFENGYAYANTVPIIYYAEGLTGNFNLMLAASGRAVAVNLDELKMHICGILKDKNYFCEYNAAIE